MSDHDPQLCDIEGCLECMPGPDQLDETAIRADERRKVIAELASEETIGYAVEAAFYRGDEPDGRWFELTREQQDECWSVMAAAITRTASLLAPEGEEGSTNG